MKRIDIYFFHVDSISQHIFINIDYIDDSSS